MLEFIIKSRKEIDEDKSGLNKLPKDVRGLAKMGHDRIEGLVQALEVQNEILHVMGIVIKNSYELIDKEPKKVKEVLGDSIKRIKELKTFFKDK